MARPRDPKVDQAILKATLDLLVEVGFGRLTVDAVSARAGVGKAAIYRRWPSKERVVLQALASKRYAVEVIDTGSLRTDLQDIYASMIQVSSLETTIALMPALAVEAANDAEVRAQLRRFVDERRQPARSAFVRAVERGEVATDVDVELCIDLLTGMVINRLFFSGLIVDGKAFSKALDYVLGGIGASVMAAELPR